MSEPTARELLDRVVHTTQGITLIERDPHHAPSPATEWETVVASRVEKVLALHWEGVTHCQGCLKAWPCPTICVLNGDRPRP